MRRNAKWRTVIGCLMLAGGWSLSAQTAGSAVAPARGGDLAPGSVVVRTTTDPATGDQWILVRDPQHPAAPGRYLLASTLKAQSPGKSAEARSAGAMLADTRRAIRGGDHIVVEESTPVLEASFDGVALQSAKTGDVLTVRLKVNGSVVRAIALGPGRAALAVMQGGIR